MTDMRICRDCGAEFKRSRQDVTVRCPDCRAKRKSVRVGADFTSLDLRIAQVKMRGYEARRAGLDETAIVAELHRLLEARDRRAS